MLIGVLIGGGAGMAGLGYVTEDAGVDPDSIVGILPKPGSLRSGSNPSANSKL